MGTGIVTGSAGLGSLTGAGAVVVGLFACALLIGVVAFGAEFILVKVTDVCSFRVAGLTDLVLMPLVLPFAALACIVLAMRAFSFCNLVFTLGLLNILDYAGRARRDLSVAYNGFGFGEVATLSSERFVSFW